MKLALTLSLLFGSLTFSTIAFAESSDNQSLAKEEKSKTTKKRRRRKKVQMCHDCGKPETECDCEGEGHGVIHDDDHQDEHHREHKD